MFKSLKNRTPLGLLQLKHDKMKMLTALAGIAFADILMFMQLGFKDALFTTNTQYPRLIKGDIVLLSNQATNFNQLYTFPRRRLYQSMDVSGVQSAQPVYIGSLNWRNPQTREKTSMMVVGFDPEQPAFNLPEVNRQLDKVKIPDTVLFDRASRGKYEEVISMVEQGKVVTTERDRNTVTIGGLFEVGASFADDGALITSDYNFLRLFPKKEQGTVSLGIINLEPGQDPVAVRQALNIHLSDDVQAYTHEEYVDKEVTYIQNRSPIGFVFTLGTTMGFIVGIVIVYQVLSTDVNDHIAEYATFKAMGYKNSYLLFVVFEEALILSLAGFIPSVILSLGLYSLTATATALPIMMPVSRAITVLIMTIIMCGISGAIATRKLQSADPADIF
ncbi:ABC transporter permease DevC [Crocosphaera sp.]|uniref:ABC transporter permease DevC n=1 Tax=Crocosphaera sp. TaxID=2729996 RepID=UPI00261944EC|nr:ABC transporter permease DevC [Crocosphaera sp.]MDJ0583380.1 ABC transporter permease DevC [Crocosphaera sp.]